MHCSLYSDQCNTSRHDKSQQQDNSVQHSKSNDLLNGMKHYLRIEHHDDNKELLDYLRKQAGLPQE